MSTYMTKERLYQNVEEIRDFLKLYNPQNSIFLTNYLKERLKNVYISECEFETPKLRAMCCFGDENKAHVIILNSCRDKVEQNFDCAHELMHLLLHREENNGYLNCFDNTLDYNSYIEWQANEGAAELLVPYRKFIPIICEKYDYITENTHNMYSFIDKYSKVFNVPYVVIKFRIDNLKYEINQYLNGITWEALNILSQKEQSVRNIKIVSPVDIAEFNNLGSCVASINVGSANSYDFAHIL